MARKRKPSGQLRKGPFTQVDVAAALKRAGAVETSGGKHQVYSHPEYGWKIATSTAWTSLRKGCPILQGIARTMRISDTELLRLLNAG